ncbi:MAG: aminotransferase class I/II-fold pyridoxal phosphate-dependent enzyme [Tissierellia bacterium]|nr:aminotransferase class I/II-fold pyridoxal phosphate-dependent enzyme [Tissierellia bacterium]
MIYFDSDYLEGCHPKIIEEITKSNMNQYHGYGDDYYTNEAKLLIKNKIKNEKSDIHFLVGGTQTNFIVIKSALKAYEAVVSADSGHIATHETGAVESTGHKVITVNNNDGKIDIDECEKVFKDHFDDDKKEHTPKPKMIYISHPTESGSLYTKKELEKLRQIADKYDAYLFLDGARLGYGLASDENDINLCDLATLTDVFYIGGTKCGAMMGEAVVIQNDNLKYEFRYHIKQNGALLAKGRFLGVQFYTLFNGDLYTRICENAIDLSKKIRSAFEQKGFKTLNSPTNQQFIFLDEKTIEKLSDEFSFETWQKMEDKTLVRFCTSWATKEENVNRLIERIKQL